MAAKFTTDIFIDGVVQVISGPQQRKAQQYAEEEYWKGIAS